MIPLVESQYGIENGVDGLEQKDAILKSQLDLFIVIVRKRERGFVL